MKWIKKIGSETFASLKNPNYRLYFIGQTVSMSGTWMQGVAQSWLVLTLTNSGTALGLVTAAQFLPVLFFGPWAGLLVDRMPKRRVLFYTNAVPAVLALLLGVLIMLGQVKLWMVFLFALASGFLNAFDNPARQTFIMEMVGKEQLTNAISLNSAQFNLSRVIGPAIAGALIAGVGLAPCFFFNALSFAAVLVALFMMNKSQLQPTKLAKTAEGQIIEGFKYVFSNALLRDTLIMMAIIGTLSYEFQVSLPLLAQFTFHGGASGYAALTSAMGLGAVIGAFYTARRKNITQKMLMVAAFLFGVTMLLTSFSPSLVLAILGMVLIGIFSINLTSLGNTTLQLESRPDMRGRVMALWAVVFLGSTPIGGPIIGYVSQYLNPRWGLALGGLAALFAAALGYWRLSRDKAVILPV